MENMQNVTAALAHLGVKTCLACGKAGAKSLCTGCRSVSFCGKACQKEAWPGHKRECRRVMRERARVLDGIAADYAADEAIAAEKCRPNIPAGAECYMCLNQAAPGQIRGELVRGCSCRGPHAGFVHIRCLVKNAEERGEYDDKTYADALHTCTQCRQQFGGPVLVALQRAKWLHFTGRAETDERRQVALGNLGAALHNARRLDEALVIKEEDLATRRRLYGPDAFRTINAEEGVAITMLDQGGDENLQRALQTLTRIHAWKVRKLGRDHERTLASAGHLVDVHRDAGNLRESERVQREALAGWRRTKGEEHFQTLEAQWLLASVLVKQNKLDEARSISDAAFPVSRRVLGPDHKITLCLSYQINKIYKIQRREARARARRRA